MQNRRVANLIEQGHSIQVEMAKERLGHMRIVNPRPFGDGTECWLISVNSRIEKRRRIFTDGSIIVNDEGRHLSKEEVEQLLGVEVEWMTFR